MWNFIADALLKYRLYFLLAVIGATIFMGFQASKVQWSYNFSSVVPAYDTDMIFFKEFKKTYGEDANLMAIGLQSEDIYQLKNFKELKSFSDDLSKMDGVKEVISLPRMQYLEKDTVNKKFISKKLFQTFPKTQAQLDSILAFASQLQFYEGQLNNPQTNAMIVLLTIEKRVLDTEKRQGLINQVLARADVFKERTKIDLHYAGIPVIRSIMTTRMAADLQLLLILSVLGMAVILFVFFRSIKAVIIPIGIIAILIVWVLGTIVLFGFKINILTGLLPPILVVIGIPNCVYLLNKYHQEYRRTKDKYKSLHYVIKRIGVVALMTNITTAIGFFVFSFMDIRVLREFGIMASVNILNTFVVSLILLPVIFSYLPHPTNSELVHLYRRPLRRFLLWLKRTVFWNRKWVYGISFLIIIVGIYGFTKIKVVSFMVDDIPSESKTKKDLEFFEQNFKGVMPLEIVVNTGKKKGVMSLSMLRKVNELEKRLNEIPLISPSISVVSFLKASKQAFYNHSPDFYELPTNQDKNFILRYLKNSEESDTSANSPMTAFVDSTGRSMRISLKVADVGSIKMDSLIHQVVKPMIREVFFEDNLPEKLNAEFMKAYIQETLSDFLQNKNVTVRVTGTTLIFIKGNSYLVSNLKISLLIAIVLIGILMAILFKAPRMILISILTNILPLLITAGLMGYFGVPLKPSTALIFSIAFGIAVDDSIHFLARYRQGLVNQKLSVSQAVELSLRETGTGMIYTSIILFSGFIIFVSSEFEGTNALGLLTATTLLCAMLANLLLLPSLLITFDKGDFLKKIKNNFFVNNYEDFSQEHQEDEEINTDLIKVKKTEK